MSDLTFAEIEQVLRGYAAGDAFGVAYEFADYQGEVNPNCLLDKDGWPSGGVSDDSMLTIMTIESLDPNSALRSQGKFLADLRASIPHLRGLGPTTRSALGLQVKEHELSQVGTSNGALMRTALLGLAFREEEARERRHFVRALAEVTHKNSTAVGCAIIGSALFADARSNGNRNSPYEVAHWELQFLDKEVSVKDWQEPLMTGVSNESTETLNAVLWTLKSSASARETLKVACELGGDTDTVAALATALIIARDRERADFESIPWLEKINWSEISDLANASRRLHQLYDEGKLIS